MWIRLVRRIFGGSLLLLALILACPNLRAQTTGATLQGVITDSQKGVLPGVTVTITNTETGVSRTVVTEATGRYRAPALDPGRYELTADLSGFVTYKRAGLTLTIGQEVRIDVTLAVAAVSETVEVTAAAPLVDVSNNTIGSTVTRSNLDSLPLVSRDFLDLANLTPGVTGVGGGGVNTSGQLRRNNSYMVDGVSNDQTLTSSSRGGFSLEAVREYKVLANQFSAEYGFSSGAIVSVVTRSGTNKNEGRVFFLGRNDALDAQDPFSHAQSSGKAPFSQQRFGGFMGGPIVKNQLFYFGSYEGRRTHETSVVTSPLVPVDQREWPNPTMEHQAFIKFDEHLSGQHSMTARYRIDREVTTGNGIGGLSTHERGSDYLARNQDGEFTDTWILSNHALNEFRFQLAQGYFISDPTAYSPIGTPAISRPSGRFGKSATLPQWGKSLRYQFVDNFSVTRSRHDFKFGTDISVVKGSAFFPRTVDGSFTFATDKPFNPDDPSTYPIRYLVENFDPYFPLPDNLFAFFGEDSWRATDNLTLNLGVRYGFETAYRTILGVPNDTNNIQPRIGFVWAPFHDTKTAIRGGWGLYVDRSFLNVQLDVAAAANSDTIIINNPGYPDPYSRGTLGTITPSKTVIAEHPTTPETSNYSLGLQRQLGSTLSISADYVHSYGFNLFNNQDLNYPPTPGAPRPDPAYGRIVQFGMEGESWSNALLLGVQYRPGGGSTVGVAYTLSKSLRDVEDFQSFAQDQNNLLGEKGPADNDRRHQLVVNFTFALPGGLQIAGVASARSGLPWDVTTGVDNNLDTEVNDRPDLANPGGDPLDKATYFKDFTGRVGNLARNANRGPAFFDLDARLSKYLTLPYFTLELFAEAFNLTNRTNLDTPNGNLRSSSFGQSTGLASGAAPREVEWGFRVNF